MENKPIWTHLSNHNLLNQSSLGNLVPGIDKRMVEIVNQEIAAINERLVVFTQVGFCNIKLLAAKRKGPG